MDNLKTTIAHIAAYISSILLVFAGGLPTANAQPSGLIKSGVLTVCNSNSNYPPMYFEANGVVQGFEIDMVKALASQMKLEIDVNRMSFQGLIPSIQSGRCDVGIGAFYMTPQKLQNLHGLPYLKAGTALLLPKGNPKGIASMEDIKGMTVAVQRGSAEDMRLQAVQQENNINFDVQRYQTSAAAASALNSKKVDAAAVTDLFAAAFMHDHKDEFVLLPTFFQDANPIGLAYKVDALKGPLENALQALFADGKYADLLRRYDIPAAGGYKPGR